MTFTIDDAKQFLIDNEQYDLIMHLDNADETTEKALIQQISLLALSYDIVPKPTKNPPPPEISPLKRCDHLTDTHKELGTEAIKNGTISALILAGGEGSRLNYHHPKGCYPISPVKQKSLFQLVLERACAAKNLYGAPIRLGFLVSNRSYPHVLNFLRDHNAFGYPLDHIDLLPQPFLPYYSSEGAWQLADANALALASNGNGGLLDVFAKTPYLTHLKNSGIKHLTLTSIDNPLSDPFDPSIIGAHIAKNSDATLIALPHNPKRSTVGCISKTNDRLSIVDYISMGENTSATFGNANIFTFSRDFLEKTATTDLPLHFVEKQTQIYNTNTHKQERQKVLKGEKLITELIGLADNPLPLLADERNVFAPVKNLHGIDSVATCQEAIYRKNRDILKEITGHPTTRNVELAAEFYYPTKNLKEKWAGKKLPPQAYITENL
ncbi:MAG: UTP--glucose-1-phosphate uridylyltransferase [Simkaniaceae bacterium]|nr:UTP--glucose-1-phosphate uridylyltransferase [Simkaniaceae bacterium]